VNKSKALKKWRNHTSCRAKSHHAEDAETSIAWTC